MDHRELRNFQKWETASGEKFLIKDLTDDHLKNILNWVFYVMAENYHDSIRELLLAEANYRKLCNFTGRKPVIVQDKDGYYQLNE